MQFLDCKNALKYVCSWGSTQDPTGGAYRASQITIITLILYSMEK